jgi:hypothetical protein
VSLRYFVEESKNIKKANLSCDKLVLTICVWQDYGRITQMISNSHRMRSFAADTPHRRPIRSVSDLKPHRLNQIMKNRISKTLIVLTHVRALSGKIPAGVRKLISPDSRRCSGSRS